VASRLSLLLRPTMSQLDARQRTALQQFQDLTGASDDDVAIGVLETTSWDVQRAVDLVFDAGPRSKTATMEPFDIDDSGVTPPAPRPRPVSLYSLARPFLAILTFPLHIVSNIFRFIFGILRIPVPQFRFSGLTFYSPLPLTRPRSSRRGPDSWLRELEEETGAVSVPGWVAGSSTGTDAAGPSTLRARPRSVEDGVKILPDFALVKYDEALRICQKEARIGCIILVSQEHDDVPEFKRCLCLS